MILVVVLDLIPTGDNTTAPGTGAAGGIGAGADGADASIRIN